jgi:signal recognition particle subunit SEC65
VSANGQKMGQKRHSDVCRIENTIKCDINVSITPPFLQGYLHATTTSENGEHEGDPDLTTSVGRNYPQALRRVLAERVADIEKDAGLWASTELSNPSKHHVRGPSPIVQQDETVKVAKVTNNEPLWTPSDTVVVGLQGCTRVEAPRRSSRGRRPRQEN